MSTLFVVRQAGIHSRRVLGIFVAIDPAVLAAKTAAKFDEDDWHLWEVIPYELGEVVECDENARPTEPKPVFSILRSQAIKQ
jgi:hypothetical protein